MAQLVAKLIRWKKKWNKSLPSKSRWICVIFWWSVLLAIIKQYAVLGFIMWYDYCAIFSALAISSFYYRSIITRISVSKSLKRLIRFSYIHPIKSQMQRKRIIVFSLNALSCQLFLWYQVEWTKICSNLEFPSLAVIFNQSHTLYSCNVIASPGHPIKNGAYQ